jgi:TrmH family RNA methyltransferase
VLSDSNARLAAARRLTTRRARRETGRFLAEGAQAVREAIARPELLIEVFVTEDAMARHRDLLERAAVAVDVISSKAAAALSETVTPQGLIAVCAQPQLTVGEVLERRPTLVVLLAEPNEPGNLGAIIRTADAAGAGAVFIDGGVDAYDGKVVRASAGSIFHLPVIEVAFEHLLPDTHRAGFICLAATGRGERDLDSLTDDGTLAAAALWLFGNEARGLPESMIQAADHAVRVPIYGSAESLNLAAAAAVCLYASARAQRGRATGSK